MRRYRNLGIYSDLVEMGIRQHGVFPALPPNGVSPTRIHDALGTFELSANDVRTEHRWTFDGVSGEEVSWSVGFGPRTHAFVLKPDPAPDRLPGVLALHCHSGEKRYGKEKIADGPQPPDPEIVRLRDELYAGRAFTHDIAKARALLDAAGYKPDAQGVRIRLTLKSSTDDTMRLLAETMSKAV